MCDVHAARVTTRTTATSSSSVHLLLWAPFGLWAEPMKSLIPHTGSVLLIFLELSDLPLQIRESMTAAPESDGMVGRVGLGCFPATRRKWAALVLRLC
jgi:hypothetical protein